MDKPLLYLDVDGVINVSPDTPGARYVSHHEGQYAIHLPLGIERRIQSLMDVFEIRWATAWKGSAHPFFRGYLGLPDESWPYVDYEQYKLPFIVRDAAGRDFVWVDDDAEYEFRGLGRDWRTVPGLTLIPLWDEGLNDEQVNRALQWAVLR